MNQNAKQGDRMAVVASLAFMPELKIGCAIPQVCTCCLKPTQNTRKVTKSSSSKYRSGNRMVRSSTIQKINFFTCPQCMEHETAYDKAGGSLISRSVLISVSILFLFYFVSSLSLDLLGLYPLTNTFLSTIVVTLVISFAVSYGVLHFVEKTIRLKPLPPGHISYEQSVDFKGWSSFTFKNVKYAQLFYLMNKKNIERYPGIKDTHGITITLKPTRHHTGSRLIMNFGDRISYLLTVGFLSWIISGILFYILTRFITV